MLIDALAQRYGVLPSVLLAEGDTFDLLCMDVAVTYQSFKNSKDNKTGDLTKYYDMDDLQHKMDTVKNG